MKNCLLLFTIIALLISCKTKNKNLEREVFDKKTQKEISKAENIITKEKFLNFIDKDMGFQEDAVDSLRLYAWCCKIQNDSVLFSGKIYLKPQKGNLKYWRTSESRDSIIELINENLDESLFSKFNLWAEITHKNFFLPLNKTIDNPCEYYKKDRVISIYSATTDGKWKLLKKTKKEEEIENVIN
ncbi:hypothetical protein Q4517_13630 [Tenacibaculum sp. 1_MG-2023]|uniref:hypothetical protein n=1 Tax=Tenacibaculum sp. 1_MG-2023 TaxID=3062653 RepID=UPI0026E25088|nr:hypothetical protein [Tenacibaculum sp. 1_MG-2023]MDO6676584.1 hypothetical protein [Tenacibaculum sp. 1_MG-2023]